MSVGVLPYFVLQFVAPTYVHYYVFYVMNTLIFKESCFSGMIIIKMIYSTIGSCNIVQLSH